MNENELRKNIFAGRTDKPHECEKEYKEKYPELKNWKVLKFEDEDKARAWEEDLHKEGYGGTDGKGGQWVYTFTNE